MTDQEAAGAALTEFNLAVVRHTDALKRLGKYSKVIDRIRSARLEVREWELSTSEDLRSEGGILCADLHRDGTPITLPMWPTFKQSTTAIRNRDESAAAAEQLRAFGMDSAGRR
ncbi:MAG: hypothetical protein OXG44_00160 [Gammaproteobacteria bacterium]|nr:hypothetical protein [Gammaproteobacteria bacterium]